MKLLYSHDYGDQYTLRTENMILVSLRAVQAWEEQMVAASDELLEARGGRKWLCLICLAGFTLDPELADEYGRRSRRIASTYFTAAIRYGAREAVYTQTAIRLGAIRNRFPSNIFRDRAAALEAAREFRPSQLGLADG